MVSFITNLKCFYKKFRITYHLELHTFLFFLSFMILSMAAYPLYYAKVCQSMYPAPDDPSQEYICNDFQGIQSNEQVQKQANDWMMYGEFAKFIPNILGSMFLGSFGDHYGRKIPTLISIVSFLMYLIFYWLFVTIPAVPLYAITILAAVTALGGTVTVFLSATSSEVADYLADNEQQMTVRYAILAACWSGAVVIGGNLSPFMMTYLGTEWTIFVGLALNVCSFFSVLFLFPATNPSTNDRRHLLHIQNSVVSSDGEPSSNSSSQTSDEAIVKPMKRNRTTFSWLIEGLSLYKSAWRVLTKQRLNRGRTYLIVYCIISLIYTCEDSGMDNITVIYVYYKPLSWSPQLYSWWSAAMSLCELVGSVGSAILFKKLLFSDITILMISLFSAAIKMTGIGIGQTTWLMFVSLLLGSLSTVGFSAMNTLVVQLGSAEETGELLSLTNIFSAFANLFAALVYNNVYSAALDFYPGFPWLMEAGLLFCCLVAVLFIYIDGKISGVKNADTDNPNNIEKF